MTDLVFQFRGSRDLGLIDHPDDITNCSIDECESSNGYLSTTYKLTAFFRCRSQITGKKRGPKRPNKCHKIKK